MFGPGFLLRTQADHLTAAGEMRRISLSDGSKVTLGPDSAIRSAMNVDGRRVELLAGMAYFEVEPDSVRPFQVVAGDMTVTVVGTAFDLSMDADTTSVAVDHGLVDVRIDTSAPGENLGAGQWLSFDQGTGTVERGVREPAQVAAWRDGVLVAQGETVAAVVARIARWQAARVVIADPGLGNQRISGVYNLDKPLNALRAVVGPHGGKVHEVTSWLTVISRI
ncbi:Iron siderophore sensor protein [plant metagenome]|uniref:Iron siderophore sensor protein n=1 Tax=plant metagenome TaxID=1297885 RepID=A0A484PLF8_9ZZZZ